MNKKKPHVFGQVLNQIRKEKNLSKYAVAKAAGKQISQVYLLEAGNSEPKVSTIIWLAKAMAMEPWELFRRLCLAMEEQHETENPPPKIPENGQKA